MLRLLLVYCVFLVDQSQASWPSSSIWNSNVLGYFQWLVPESFIENNVFFYLYTRFNRESPDQLLIGNREVLKRSHFDKTKKTVIIVHGWNTDYLPPEGLPQKAKYKYFDNEDVNFIAIDYGGINEVLSSTIIISYLIASFSSVKIGNHLGKLVGFLVEEGADPRDIHMIGHSLGAHIAGFAGKYCRSNGYHVGRITDTEGKIFAIALALCYLEVSMNCTRKRPKLKPMWSLDACYPFYEGSDSKYRLDSTDAIFTDCIWTSYDSTGMGSPTCQTNFFPNGAGKGQPGCFMGDIEGKGCSHSRSVSYFLESIGSPTAFQSRRCSGIPWYNKQVYCLPHPSNSMGRYAEPKAGVFYVKTNDNSPFSQS